MDRDLQIPASPGEFLDRLTILQLKADRCVGKARQVAVQRLWAMGEQWRFGLAEPNAVREIRISLARINASLWEIEDRIRELDRLKQFDEEFIELARQVYQLNDQRSEWKTRLDMLLGCEPGDLKQYGDSDATG